MVYTEARAWLDAHELIECKALKGKWTKKTCLDISRKVRKSPRNSRSSHEEVPQVINTPCVNCPIYATLEK